MASISSLGIGSGLDLNGLLDQLESAERQKLSPIVAQQSSYKAKISAFGKIESALDSFQQAAAKLTKAETFQAVTSKVSGSEGLTATTDATAVPGTYQVAVDKLAQAHSVAGGGVASKSESLGSGTLDISLDSGESMSIDLSDSSLEDIRDAINTENKGVSASIINDGSTNGYRLVLTSQKTGQSSNMTVGLSNVTGDAGLTTALTTTEQVAAQDASLTVNNITITSASNQIEEAIQGVTLDLTQESVGASSTVTVSRDEETIQGDIQAFVDAYNALQTTIDSATAYNGEGSASGHLIGDNRVRTIESRLRQTVMDVGGGNDFNRLADIGINLTSDGKLEVDSDKLGQVVSDNPNGVKQFFAGVAEEGGLASKLDESLSAMLEDQGLVGRAITGFEDRIDALGERYTRTEESINNTVERYRKQFAQMDAMVSQMNSTMSYLGQQFEAMNAQLSQ
ncbi:flagellar filament capping protein FliD [Halomonas sp. HP20-15]|uniref:flagellar filament capping protein FliD n=1 Tax=Halomonas sp. HP20-15 TaxID=3085901 RepID=UPI002981EB63|nr:flagellar filament capping protein FliD [Halomonas sp. HP20-15]MDW5375688.1 flagellar filament capping protein FliD [Halomonas sp. HP20-15]